MNTTEYSKDDIIRLLHLEHCNIDTVNVMHSNDTLIVTITLARKIHHCPVCDAETSSVANYVVKKINHTLNNQKCIIYYRTRRYRCPVCHKTFNEESNITFGNERSSAVTVFNVLEELKDPNNTFTSVGKRYRLSANTVSNLFDRHINIPRGVLPKALVCDEVYVKSDNSSNYMCILMNFETFEIIDVIPSRKKHDLIKYFSSIPREERMNVEVFCSDLWVTYQDVAKMFFPRASRSIDLFHLEMEMTRQFTHVRCRVMKKYSLIKKAYENQSKQRKLTATEKVKLREASVNYYALKKFNWLFFKMKSNQKDYFNPNNKKRYNQVFGRYMNFYDIFTHMCSCDSELEEACNLKYAFDTFTKKTSYEDARENLENLITEFRESGISEMKHFAGTLASWKLQIINAFIEVGGYRINSCRLENRNRTIKKLKSNANGYRDFTRLRKRIMYCCNHKGIYTNL